MGDEDALPDYQEVFGDLQESLWEMVEKCVYPCNGEKEQLYGLVLAHSDILLMTRLTSIKQVESSIELRLVMPLPFGSRCADLLQHNEGKQED